MDGGGTMSTTSEYDGLVAAVTGGASGIGALGTDAVAYLASPSSGSTTGTALAVDGGMNDLRLRPRS